MLLVGFPLFLLVSFFVSYPFVSGIGVLTLSGFILSGSENFAEVSISLCSTFPDLNFLFEGLVCFTKLLFLLGIGSVCLYVMLEAVIPTSGL